MAMLYPNICYDKMCYKWIALYVIKTKHKNVLLLNLVI